MFFHYVVPWHNGTGTKWLTFCRRHFQLHFLGWKPLYFDSNFAEIYYKESIWQYVSIVSGDGLAPVRRQAIVWTNDDPVCRHIFVTWPQRICWNALIICKIMEDLHQFSQFTATHLEICHRSASHLPSNNLRYVLLSWMHSVPGSWKSHSAFTFAHGYGSGYTTTENSAVDLTQCHKVTIDWQSSMTPWVW